MGILTVGVGMSLTLLFAPQTVFLPLGSLVQSCYECLCLVLLHLVVPVWLISLGSLLFSEGIWRNSRSGDRGQVWRGTGRCGGDAVVWMFSMKEDVHSVL